MSAIVIIIYVASIVALAAYGLYGFLTLWLFLRHRRSSLPVPPAQTATLPSVTVQLPIYNERDVIQRLIDAVAAFDYPRDRLEIQVLDDSTDDTTRLAAECVAAYVARGTDVVLIHREHRYGYKAGALQEALASAKGDYIAIFDADFVPPPDFLSRMVPYFQTDARIGAVQARWGHLNAADSPLTAAQAVALDKHFAVDQLVRYRTDYFPKFNGSAGIWRRSCIVEAGGWQSDTVCEDLCLSTRAVLAGWQLHFANDVVAPAELPSSILAFKVQQARWAMGATQCLLKYTPSICRAKSHSRAARLYALCSMSAYLTHVLLVALLLAQLPLLLTGVHLPPWMLLFGLAGLGQPILFVIAQRSLYPDWLSRLRYFPALLLVAIGIAPSGALAVLKALSARNIPFARTPKGAAQSYRLPLDRVVVVEIGLVLYATITLILALRQGNNGPLFFLVCAILGFGYVALLGIRETFTVRVN
jgi:cellulose synthase/poly-beta-1,6-N-acetylglucosamine synthase-like glycosyltransferase